MLSVENLHKEFNCTAAVNGVSFSINKSKIFGLLGPNGAGKTTILRLILGILKPSQGKISFNGKEIDSSFFNMIGYLPEERGLYRKSKTIDAITYFAELKNMPHEKIQYEAAKWLEIFNLKSEQNKRIEELSKGNQQKVQFITTVMHSPDLLILDEPFDGFDPIYQELIKEVLLSKVSEGKIIILSTHQMETVEKLCSEIFLINKGKEVYSGSLNNLKKKFSGSNVRMKFDGDGSFLKKLEIVEQINYYNNYAEIKLKNDISPNKLLEASCSRLSISNFSTQQPSLHEIFIDLIK